MTVNIFFIYNKTQYYLKYKITVQFIYIKIQYYFNFNIIFR